MRVRMFQERFAPLIVSGAKRRTIRPYPKIKPKVGQVESWRKWIGKPYRSAQVELAVVRLIGVGVIQVQAGFIETPSGVIAPKDFDGFARADGFEGAKEFFEWFDMMHGFPFWGILIEAEDAAEKEAA